MRYFAVIFVMFIMGFVFGLHLQHKLPNQTQIGESDPALLRNDETYIGPVYEESTHEQPKDIPPPRPTDTQLFVVGEHVTCIYQGVFSWTDGDQFLKTIPLECIILEVTAPEDMSSYGQSNVRQNIHVDCTKSVIKNTGSPGIGLVPHHKLNVKKRWYATEDCYHFVQEN